MTAQAGGTGGLYHNSGVSSRLINTLDTRQRLYYDLAYCRMRLCRLRHNPQWAEFYRRDIARLERLLESRRRSGRARENPGDLKRQITFWTWLAWQKEAA